MLIIFLLLVWGFNIIMKEKLGVESKKFFSYNHVNEKYKKIDWIMRISFTVIILIVYFYKVTINPGNNSWYTNIGLIGMLFIISSETVRAIMEWKYSSNKKEYILTTSNIVFVTIFFWVVLKKFSIL